MPTNLDRRTPLIKALQMRLPSSNRTRFLLLALVVSLATTFIFLATRDTEPESWPYTSVDTARLVPLSDIVTRLDTAVDGRRAAVLGAFIYVESPSDSLDADTLRKALPVPETAPEDALDEDGALKELPAEIPDTVTERARLPFPADDLVGTLSTESAVPLTIEENPGFEASWVDRLFQILPILIILLIVALVLSRGAGRGLGLNSSFEVIEKDKLREDFSSVAGVDTARGEIQEIVDFLKNPSDSARLGGRMPKGAIFSGPPGTGKTLLARAMAKEAGVPFLSIEASGVNQLFVGAGAMKIKRAFREARKRAPCIVFIDEIDAMGRARGSVQSSAGDEKETTLNALLVELDGFDAREGVVVIAATNRPEILDKALTRRGRIDRHVHIDLPDKTGRAEILNVHISAITTCPDLDVTAIAGRTFGLSGADLAALVNEAALVATRQGHATVQMEDFEAARERMIIGVGGARKRLTEAERRLTAVHEAGHALIAAASPHADPIEKATILPQGGALGYVMQSPDEDRAFETRARLRGRIRVAVAGRVAEEILYGSDRITSGAASDIDQATTIAHNMIMRFGMSPLGFVRATPQDPASQSISHDVFVETQSLIAREMDLVRHFMTENTDHLTRLADALEASETLDGESILDLVRDVVDALPDDLPRSEALPTAS